MPPQTLQEAAVAKALGQTRVAFEQAPLWYYDQQHGSGRGGDRSPGTSKRVAARHPVGPGALVYVWGWREDNSDRAELW